MVASIPVTTQATKTTGFDFVPYFKYERSDPITFLSSQNIWVFPPSANISPADQLLETAVELCYIPYDRLAHQKLPISGVEQELLIEFQKILGPFKSSNDPRQLKSWIQRCRKLKINLDVDRIARYAVCHKKQTVVEYLVDEEQANLTQRDTLGRSAIFYAVVKNSGGAVSGRTAADLETDSLSTLSYISRYTLLLMGDKSKIKDLLDQTDTCNRRTALHYAVVDTNLCGAELLLANNANLEMTDKKAHKPIDLINPRASPLDLLQLRLILEFNKLLPAWPHYVLGRFRETLASSFQHPVPVVHVDLSPETEQKNTFLHGNHDWSSSNRFHVPCMNGLIVFALLRQFGRRLGSPTFAIDTLSDWLQSPLPTTHSGLINREPGYSSDLNNERCSIVFPCLALRTRKSAKEASETTKKWRQNISNHDNFKRLVQPERTIDETYFPSLSARTLGDRNQKQIVSRETKKIACNEQANDDQILILMVPQLWIWRFEHFVLTAYSSVNPGYPTDEECKHIEKTCAKYPDISVGLIIADEISKFGGPQINGKFPSPLDIFETNIVGLLSEVDAYVNPSVKSPLEMIKEQKFLFEISDIQEELAMIQYILSQQLDILDKLIQDVEHLGPDRAPFLGPVNCPERVPNFSLNTLEDMKRKWEEIKLSRIKIEAYQKRVEKLNGDAKRIESRIQDQLNLKRTHASIKEARSARILSAAVIGFTVVTIIFTPLSFMTSLFALSIDVLQQNQLQMDRPSGTTPADNPQTTTTYSTSYVGKWFAAAELVTLAVTGLIVGVSLWAFGDTKLLSKRQEEHSANATGAHEYRQGEKQETASRDHRDENVPHPEKMNLRKRVIGVLNGAINVLERGESVEGGLESARNAPAPA
ncbi:hypothetical protein F5X98DRAFT_387866 [Xylaria grammica]|nr:hypothetical protein F5X98DRAFT_387866 [Xylaria grammica]